MLILSGSHLQARDPISLKVVEVATLTPAAAPDVSVSVELSIYNRIYQQHPHCAGTAALVSTWNNTTSLSLVFRHSGT